MLEAQKEDPKSLTDFLRERLKGVLNAAAGFLLKIGLSANALTLIGLVRAFRGGIFALQRTHYPGRAGVAGAGPR